MYNLIKISSEPDSPYCVCNGNNQQDNSEWVPQVHPNDRQLINWFNIITYYILLYYIICKISKQLWEVIVSIILVWEIVFDVTSSYMK